MKDDPSRNRADDRSSSPGLRVWGRIVSELAQLQDTASPESPGAVVNPICKRPYVVDTCCAAAVFAAEYQRTSGHGWLKRAGEAVAAVPSDLLFRGIDEPFWDVLGWHDVPESLAATGIAVEAYLDALDRLAIALDADHVGDLLDLLQRCRTPNGGFAHNAVTASEEGLEVQNATATALNVLGRLARAENAQGHPLYSGLEATVKRLDRGQGRSGFWPYHYPGRRWRSREVLASRPIKILFAPGRFDTYHGYGDVMHHLMTLYFAAGYCSSSGSRANGMLVSGWGWIRKRLVPGADGSLSIDWRGEPTLSSPQSSNARDTNAYFLLLGTLARLTALGVVDRDDSSAIEQALLVHIGSELAAERGGSPCIAPHEGPVEIVRNILPMFEQSVAWKGHLMAEAVLAREAA